MRTCVTRILQLFQQLQRGAREHDSHVDVQRLVRLEWQYLGLLDGQLASPATLYRMLQSDPAVSSISFTLHLPSDE